MGGVNLELVMPYFNDGNEMMSFMDETISKERLEKADKDMFMDYMYIARSIIQNQTDKNCTFLKRNQLTIDEHGYLLRCCTLNKKSQDYSIGNFMELSPEEIIKRQEGQSEVCDRCIKLVNPDYFHSRDSYMVPKPLISKYINEDYDLIPRTKKDVLHHEKVIIETIMRYLLSR